MLSKNSLMTSVSLATEYAEKNQVVTVKPNTVLADLVRVTNANLANVACAAGEFDIYADNVEMITTGDLTTPTEHSKVSDAYIDDISKAVNNHISFAKNVVSPIVVDFTERVLNYMENFKPPQAVGEFDISMCIVPELLEDESFVDTLRFYEEKPVVEPSLVPAFGNRSDEDLLALLQTGDADADEAITAWYSRLGPEFFQHVWISFFQARDKNVNPNYSTYRDMIEKMDMFEKADYALAMYLFTAKLFEAVPDDVGNQSLTNYQNTLSQTRDFAGAILSDFITRVVAFKKSNTLIISFHANQKGARVFGPNYQRWLENGGSPEIIIGLIVSGKRFTLQSLIDDASAVLLENWKTFEHFHNAAQSNKYFDYYKEALELKFAELMGGITKEEEAFAQNSPNYVANVNQRFQEELKQIRIGDLDNLYMTAVKLICRSRFYYTDAESILFDIEEARRINPEIDVREAALIATANYVFDYIADQMSVVKE